MQRRRADRAQPGDGPFAGRRAARQEKAPPVRPANADQAGQLPIAIKTDPSKPLSRLEKLRLESKEKSLGVAAPR